MRTAHQEFYTSNEATYELDPQKLFTIVHLLNQYCTHETNKFVRGDYRGTTWLQGNGEMLHVNTESSVTGPLRVTLADLILDLENKKLKCKVYAHSGLIADPKPLIEICEGYKPIT